jgi:hypothetical protein
MSTKQIGKLQILRPEPFKPSVVKEFNLWWAKVWIQEGPITEQFFTHREAWNRALELAAEHPITEPTP